MKNAIEYKEKFVEEISEEIKTIKISKQHEGKDFQDKVKEFQKEIENEVYSTIPTAFWHKKKYVNLPYIKDFNEEKIPTKAGSI